MKVTGIIGTIYTLEGIPIGSGGEGDIYSVRSFEGVYSGSDKIAKIYKSGVLSEELEEKLKIMIEHPPSSSVLSQVAWPLDIAYDEDGLCCGFIMPKLSINAELGEIYKYPSTLPISLQQKINIAQNICAVISEVHAAGYVFGDFNPRNIGLDKDTGLVSFLDTDTYHVTNGDKTYRCNVCASGYAAPELLEKCSDYIAENPMDSKNAYEKTPLPTFTKETDNFALAIHIFKLLMNGYTPFGGILESTSVSQSSPGVGDAAVRRNSYCFKPGFKPQSVAIPGIETLPDKIQDLFTRAFIVGRHDPKARPDAIEWHKALVEYEQMLVNCSLNNLHQYDKKNESCPLCEADERFNTAVGSATQRETLKQNKYTQTPLQTPPLQRQTIKVPITPAPVPSPAPTQTQTSSARGLVKWGASSAKKRIIIIVLACFCACTIALAIVLFPRSDNNIIIWGTSTIRADGTGSYFENEYDVNGNRIKSTSFNTNGTAIWRREYEYDINGNQVKHTSFNEYGMVEWSEYEYDINGNQVKHTSFNGYGMVDSWLEFEYNTNNNLIKSTLYYRSGVSGWIEYEYDANGNLIKQTWLTVNGVSSGFEHEYNANGNLIKKTWFTGDGTRNTWLEFEYDANNNHIKSTRLHNDSFLTEWEELKYDSNNNLIKHTWFNRDGTVRVWDELEYDSDNNQIKHTRFHGDSTVIWVEERVRVR